MLECPGLSFRGTSCGLWSRTVRPVGRVVVVCGWLRCRLFVDDLALRWSLDVGRAFQPGGVASWVAAARNAVGEHLVLKVG